MGYNARNDEIRDNVTWMRREWEAQRGALATVRRFNAALSAKDYVWFWPKIAAALTSKRHWLVIVCDSCGTVVDLDLRVKPRDPEASIRVALRDVHCSRVMVMVDRVSLPWRGIRRFEGCEIISWLRKAMRGATYLIIVTLASMLTLLSSAVAQRERGQLRLEERRLEQRTFLGPQTSSRRVYHGRLAWKDGRWHHALRNGRDGWWWDVGGIWYFYPEQIEGPPDYVSDVEVAADDVVDAPSPPPKPKRAFYYSPGDLKGVPYDTIEECTKVIQQAGDVGVCVYK